MNHYEILKRVFEKTLSQNIDNQGPCDPPQDTPRPIPFDKEWGREQMKCCKCLVYGETECGNQGCAECVAWVMRNRRKNPQSSRWKNTPCGQALNTDQFNGGWGKSDKFKDCWCDTAGDNPSVNRCLKQAETACNRVGGGYFDTDDGPNPNDPTGGANYYHRCDLVNDHTKDIECNVKAGICRKVTTGACANCDHCFYVCDSMPKPCEDLFPDGIDVDENYEYDV